MKELPEYHLKAVPMDEDAKKAMGFEWADTSVGRRHKIGGKPSFIQHPAIPHCSSCGEEMTFYGQLDSIGDSLCLADCGIIYVFVCFDCYQTASFIQSG